MGSASSKKTVKTSSQEKRQRIELKRLFNSTKFNEKSSFWSETCFLFTGNYICTSFTQSLFKCFRKFMIEVSISLKHQESTSNDPCTPSLFPPPLVEEVWMESLQHPDLYSDLCNNLFSQKLEKSLIGSLEGFESLFLHFWPSYSKDFWQLDRKYTIWILDSELEAFLKQIHEYVFLRTSLKHHQEVFKIYFHLNMVREMLNKKKNSETCKRFYCEPAQDNYFYGLDVSVIAEEKYEKILESLEKDVKEFIDTKLCLGDMALVFFEEYARFLTMAYFQPSLVTPSYSVEMIWRVHRSISLEYHKFSQKVFGKEIEYVTVEDRHKLKVNLVKGYQKTIDLYIALFKQRPPQLVWPVVDDWVNFSNYKGSWFSLLRIIESTQKVIEIFNSKEFKIVPLLAAYFSWGKNLKTEKLKDFMESKKIIKGQNENIIFLDEGTEPVEVKWNHFGTKDLEKKDSVKSKKTKEFKENQMIFDDPDENPEDFKEKNEVMENFERKTSPKKTGKSEKKEERKSSSPKKVKHNEKIEKELIEERKQISPKKIVKEDLKNEEIEKPRIKNRSPKKNENLLLDDSQASKKASKNKSPEKSGKLLDDTENVRKESKNKRESPAKPVVNLLDDSDFVKKESKKESPVKSGGNLLDDSDFIRKESKNKTKSPEKPEKKLLDDSDIIKKEPKKKKDRPSKAPSESLEENDSTSQKFSNHKKNPRKESNKSIEIPSTPEKIKEIPSSDSKDEDLNRKPKTMHEKHVSSKVHKTTSKSKENSFTIPLNEDLLLNQS